MSNEIGGKAPRDARLVVLPNYQGIGLGPLMLRTYWKALVASGNVLHTKTKHPCFDYSLRAHDSKKPSISPNVGTL